MLIWAPKIIDIPKSEFKALSFVFAVKRQIRIRSLEAFICANKRLNVNWFESERALTTVCPHVMEDQMAANWIMSR